MISSIGVDLEIGWKRVMWGEKIGEVVSCFVNCSITPWADPAAGDFGMSQKA